MRNDYWVNDLVHLQYSSLPSLRWQARTGGMGYAGGIYISINGEEWRLLGNISDLNVWSSQQVVDQVLNAFDLKKGDEEAQMPILSDEAHKAGEDSAELWTALLGKSLPNPVLYKFARKVAKYDGFVGDAAFDYVEGFVSMFGVYRSANQRSLQTSQRLEVPDE